MGGKVEVSGCVILVCYIFASLEVTMDLVLFYVLAFNVIIGIDWLAQHHVVLNCCLKKVIFQTSCGSHLSFYGDQRLTLISPIQDLDNCSLRKDGG